MNKILVMSPETRRDNLARVTDPAERAGLLTYDRDTRQPRTPGGKYAAGPAHGPRKIVIMPVGEKTFKDVSTWQGILFLATHPNRSNRLGLLRSIQCHHVRRNRMGLLVLR